MVGLLAGAPVAGSWWGHPAGKTIFDALQVIDDDPDIALFKLLNRKVVFVHRRLWPDVAAMGMSGEPWQTEGLSGDEAAALEQVRAAGELSGRDLGGLSKAVTGLETRLLVVARQMHMPDGGHAKVVTSWPRWLAEVGETPRDSAADARCRIEEAIAALYPDGKVRPPWIGTR